MIRSYKKYATIFLQSQHLLHQMVFQQSNGPLSILIFHPKEYTCQYQTPLQSLRLKKRLNLDNIKFGHNKHQYFHRKLYLHLNRNERYPVYRSSKNSSSQTGSNRSIPFRRHSSPRTTRKMRLLRQGLFWITFAPHCLFLLVVAIFFFYNWKRRNAIAVIATGTI